MVPKSLFDAARERLHGTYERALDAAYDAEMLSDPEDALPWHEAYLRACGRLERFSWHWKVPPPSEFSWLAL